MERIVIDWGSSNLRAYLLGASGQLLEQRHSSDGALALGATGFHAAFMRSCGDWLQRRPGIPVLMSGMVGARNGWQETPYIPCPADPCALRAGFTELAQFPELNIRIAPGVRCTNPSGSADVMRGEEVQVFGALQLAERRDALLLLPGTHSKWVSAANGRIENFTTYLTGELFALLCEHSSVGSAGPQADLDVDEFVRGLEISRAGDSLLQQIFSVRARQLCAAGGVNRH
ncbi:2-dehydro-3-deoxygalactonokinase [Microbulbifer taiwanensis]|uniref:2-dehydro-3-deoxygalactonokinase n=1 Tax=Microbulbifer taiwanensis TaxID=986746 RepID=UPI003608F7E5